MRRAGVRGLAKGGIGHECGRSDLAVMARLLAL